MEFKHFNKILIVQMIAALTALFLVYHYTENYEEYYLKNDEARNLLAAGEGDEEDGEKAPKALNDEEKKTSAEGDIINNDEAKAAEEEQADEKLTRRVLDWCQQHTLLRDEEWRILKTLLHKQTQDIGVIFIEFVKIMIFDETKTAYVSIGGGSVRKTWQLRACIGREIGRSMNADPRWRLKEMAPGKDPVYEFRPRLTVTDAQKWLGTPAKVKNIDVISKFISHDNWMDWIYVQDGVRVIFNEEESKANVRGDETEMEIGMEVGKKVVRMLFGTDGWNEMTTPKSLVKPEKDGRFEKRYTFEFEFEEEDEEEETIQGIKQEAMMSQTETG